MLIRFDAWRDGHVAPTRHQLRVINPRISVKLEPVSSRLKQELIHPDRSGGLAGLHFSPDGKRVIAGDYPGGMVVVWEASTGQQLTTIDTGFAYRASFDYLFLSPDWRTLYVSSGKRKPERVEQDGKRMVRWSFDGGIRGWSPETGVLVKTYKHRPPRNIIYMVMSPDGKRFVTCEEVPGVYEAAPKQAYSLWDVATGRDRALPEGMLSAGAFFPDSQRLAVGVGDADGYADAVKVLDLGEVREKVSIPVKEKNAWVNVLAVSPDGRLLLGNEKVYERRKQWEKSQDWFKWWDAASGREVASFGLKAPYEQPRFSPDGRTVVALSSEGDKRELLFFDVAQRRLAKRVLLATQEKGQRLVMTPPVFSPDGRWLALVTRALPANTGRSALDALDLPQPRIRLVNAVARELRETLVAPQCFMSSLCFSPDGRALAAAGLGKVLLWDTADLADRSRAALGH